MFVAQQSELPEDFRKPLPQPPERNNNNSSSRHHRGNVFLFVAVRARCHVVVVCQQVFEDALTRSIHASSVHNDDIPAAAASLQTRPRGAQPRQ